MGARSRAKVQAGRTKAKRDFIPQRARACAEISLRNPPEKQRWRGKLAATRRGRLNHIVPQENDCKIPQRSPANVLDNRNMERNLASGLAARLVVFGLLALFIYWAMPGSGASAMKKMNAAMQNARSWRVQTMVAEPTKIIESLTEVYCPSRVHTVNKTVLDESGRHYEDSSESIWIEGTNYAKKGSRWVTSQEDRSRTASCTWGPRGTDTLLQSLDAILVAGKIQKGDKRIVNGERCRDWIASVPAPTGWRDEFTVCVGDKELPLEVFTPDRRLVETYTDWNAAIRIEAPPAEELNPR